MSEDDEDRLRGGKASARDPWFGLSAEPGFKDFKRFWHREKRFHGRDLQSRAEAYEEYQDWAATHLPKPKGG